MGEAVQSIEQELASPHPDLEIHVHVTQWTGSPEYTWQVATKVVGLGGDSGRGLPEIIRGLRSGVEAIERWPTGMVPGELSKTVHSEEFRGYIISELTAKAREEYRWIQYRVQRAPGRSARVNLSTSQALQMADELEKASQMAQEMISFLESLDRSS